MSETSETAGDPASTLQPPEPDPAAAMCHATRDETIRRLEAVSGGQFFAMLLTQLTRRLQWQFSAGRETRELVTLAMALEDLELIRKMLYGVRQAMRSIGRVDSMENQELAAAAGLHYIGFRQLVLRSSIAPVQGEYLVSLMKIDAALNPAHKDPQLIIGAVVVSAVFGGVLEFDTGGLSRNPSHVRRLVVPTNADSAEDAIDRTLFAAWFPADARTPGIADGTLPMTPGDYSRLNARIAELREGDELAVGLWVPSGEQHHALLSSTGKKFKIPILLETSAAVQEALGMPTSDFLAQLGEYWKLDTELRQSLASPLVAAPPQSANPSTLGEKNVTNIGNVIFNNHDKSQNVIGDGANLTLQIANNGLDAEALTPLLQTLAAAIAALDDSHAKKAGYEADLQVLVDQSKAAKPDKSRMANALENLKKAPEYLKGGEAFVTAGKAIVDAATSIYHSVASFLTVNPVLNA